LITTPALFFTTIVEFGVPAFFLVVGGGFRLLAFAEPTKSRSGPLATSPAASNNGTRRRSVDVTPIYFNKKRAEYSPIQMTSTKCQ
jgi:hypothetical protein